MGRGVSRIQRIVYGAGLLLILGGVWEVLLRFGKVTSLVVPMPSAVVVKLCRLMLDSEFMANIVTTCGHWLVALIIGILVGGSIAMLAGTIESVSASISPAAGFIRALPPITIFPVALLALGPGGTAIVLVAAVGAAAYVFPGAAVAAAQSAAKYRNLAFVLNCSSTQFLRFFILPGAAIHLLTSARTAATYSFAICVAAEMVIGGVRGVGAAILDNSLLYRLDVAYAYILFTGLLGIAIDFVFGLFGRLPFARA